jgi:1,4-alpha-glucan branching enzyme
MSRQASIVGELDLHLINQGRHERLWTALGAHPWEDGVSFAVWAPNARAVCVFGDFNGWDGFRAWPLRPLGSSGVWQATVPNAMVGQRYKYRIQDGHGWWQDKADPFAMHSEVPPGTASIIYQSHYRWQDKAWLSRRATLRPERSPMSIYEVHLGSWRPGLSYRELADQLTDYVVQLGFTHVEMLPVMAHPYGGSWGYQVTGYYAPAPGLGEPDDFRFLVDQLHQAGLAVILDWVPGHFPRDDWALARFDGSSLYEHGDWRRGEHPDWGTYIFDYGRSEVRNFLVANALYWCAEFHADGLRVDGVASMLYLDYSRTDGQWEPNRHGGRTNLEAISFVQEMNATVYRCHPGVVTIAEESTSWPGVTSPTDHGGLGFGLKWNMGWMHDTLSYLSTAPDHRRRHHHRITFASMYALSENYVLPISHDEVVHGKRPLVDKVPNDLWQRLATIRAALAFMWAHPGKQLLFMGCELADDREWNDVRGPAWHLLDQPDHAGVQRLVRDLNAAYRDTRALWTQDTSSDGFRWIDADDVAHSCYTFLRTGDDGSKLACVVNFAAAPHEDYLVGLPAAGTWCEIINTDSRLYGGSGVGNLGRVSAKPRPSHGLPASARLRVPPLGALWLQPERQGVPAHRPVRGDVAGRRIPTSAGRPDRDAGSDGERRPT